MTAKARPKGGSSSPAIQQWNIAIGNFFFRFRNMLFPLVFLTAVVTVRPQVVLGSATLNGFLVGTGTGMALAGGALRLLTIGFKYIHRGGKNRTIYAGNLVTGGMFACTRNPMYLANLMIATGMILTTCSPEAYGILIPFFLLVYQAILAAEEEYLFKKFGRQYEEYCATVNRFLPSVRNMRSALSGMVWDWRRAVRKDLSTIMGLSAGLIMLPVWRAYFLEGLPVARDKAMLAITVLLLASGFYAVLLYLKRSRKALF